MIDLKFKKIRTNVYLTELPDEVFNKIETIKEVISPNLLNTKITRESDVNFDIEIINRIIIDNLIKNNMLNNNTLSIIFKIDNEPITLTISDELNNEINGLIYGITY